MTRETIFSKVMQKMSREASLNEVKASGLQIHFNIFISFHFNSPQLGIE